MITRDLSGLCQILLFAVNRVKTGFLKCRNEEQSTNDCNKYDNVVIFIHKQPTYLPSTPDTIFGAPNHARKRSRKINQGIIVGKLTVLLGGL